MRKLIYITFSLLFLTACSTLQQSTPTQGSITYKPWDHFDGQLSVLESTHRWQVRIHWQADLESGKARLTHAETGRIIELQWRENHIQVRDNQASTTALQPIKITTPMQ